MFLFPQPDAAEKVWFSRSVACTNPGFLCGTGSGLYQHSDHLWVAALGRHVKRRRLGRLVVTRRHHLLVELHQLPDDVHGALHGGNVGTRVAVLPTDRQKASVD